MIDEFNKLVPYYRMATERWPTANTLKNHFSSLVLCYQNEQIGLIEHIKSYIESVCLTILTDFGVELEKSSPSTSEMLSQIWGLLGIENTRGVSKIDKIISGYNKIADAINEMRNESGIVVHGKDGFFEMMQKEHMRSFILAGDSILCLIFSALDGKEPDMKYTREPYERFSRFNTMIDNSVLCKASTDDDEKIIVIDFYHEQNGSEIQLRIEPSRMLFSLDRDAYIELMESSTSQALQEIVEEIPKIPIFDQTPPKFEETPTDINLQDLKQIKKYEGIYSEYLIEFKRYLEASITDKMSWDSEKLASAILHQLEIYQYPEWKTRHVLKAKIVITIKRLLIYFGVTYEEHELPDKIYHWLITNIIY